MSKIGHWPLTEWSGQANDISGSGNHGTINGATQGVYGVGGLTAYSFDGSDDFVDVDGVEVASSTDTFSISAWFRTPDDGTDKTIYAEGNSGDNTPFNYFRVNGNSGNGEVEVFISDSNGDAMNPISDNPQNDNNWHHAVVVRDGSLALLYIDGSLVDTERNSNVASTISLDQSRIGVLSRPSNILYYSGYIADVRVYNRVLFPSEIQTLYDMGAGDYTRPSLHDGSDQGAVSRWRFDSSTDDLWGSNHGSANGDASVGSNQSIQNGSLALDGTGDYIEVSDDSSLKPSRFTVSTWFKTNDMSTSQLIVDKMDEGNNGYRIIKYQDPSELSFHILDGGNNSDVVTTDFTSGNWYHAVMTYDSSRNKLTGYLNGSKLGEATGSITHADENMIIGGRLKDNSHDLAFDGKIDDVRIYDRALSSAEVAQLYRWGTRGKDLRKRLVMQ